MLLCIGEVRSLIGESVNVIVLTATTTKAVRVELERVMGMRAPDVIAVSPSKGNISYAMCRCEIITDASFLYSKVYKKNTLSFPVQYYTAGGSVIVEISVYIFS